MIKIKDKYDVVVIGAGPSGSVAARFAAENGASVLILERDREPGIPVRCAEGVSHKGIEPFIDIDKRWIASTIDEARLHAPNGKHVDMFQNGTGYVLERRIFDTELCNLACKHGATLITKADATGIIFEDNKIQGVKYTHIGEKKTVKCNIVIGADGVESRVGRWAGIKTNVRLEDIDTCVQYTMANVDIKENRCEFYFGNEKCPGGYIWIFPKSNSTANIGLGIAGHLTDKKSPKEYLDEFVQERFPNASISYTVYGGVPTSTVLKETVKDNIMLVGDAARQVNPITGGGIVQGMIGGAFAGKVAADAVKKNDFSKKNLKTYEKKWNKALGANQRFMFEVKENFMGMDDSKFNNLVEMCSKIPQKNFTLKDLFKEAVKGDPKLIAQMAKSFVVSRLNLRFK